MPPPEVVFKPGDHEYNRKAMEDYIVNRMVTTYRLLRKYYKLEGVPDDGWLKIEIRRAQKWEGEDMYIRIENAHWLHLNGLGKIDRHDKFGLRFKRGPRKKKEPKEDKKESEETSNDE